MYYKYHAHIIDSVTGRNKTAKDTKNLFLDLNEDNININEDIDKPTE